MRCRPARAVSRHRPGPRARAATGDRLVVCACVAMRAGPGDVRTFMTALAIEAGLGPARDALTRYTLYYSIVCVCNTHTCMYIYV
jgi:hypothetical protein